MSTFYLDFVSIRYTTFMVGTMQIILGYVYIFLLQIVDKFDFKCLNKTEIKANTSQVLVPSTNIKLEFSRLDSSRKDRSF